MKATRPRSGTMGVWPRKRAKSEVARIRAWATTKDAKPLGFAGYKVGMTHAIVTDNRPNSINKGNDLFVPVTIIECPPLKVMGINCYTKTPYGLTLSSTILHASSDKHLKRSIPVAKNITKKVDDIDSNSCHSLRLLVHTQPAKTTIGKKKPELFELALGGDVASQLAYAKEHLGKDLNIADVFSAGNQIDIHAITKGKGFQGPVKRFGIGLKASKSEKGRRNPGSLGGWKGQGHFMYRIAHAGQMGYHQRTDFNKWLLSIGDKPEEIVMKGGFMHYGNVKNTYILVKGSVHGPSKRLIKFTHAIRPNKKIPKDAPSIDHLHLATHQGKARDAA